MLHFIFKKLLYGLFVLFGVVTVIFFLFNILPGDPARMMMGQRADVSSLKNIKRELGLDKSVTVRYLSYLNDLSPISVHNPTDKQSYWYLSPQKYKPYKILFSINSHMSIVLKSPNLRRSYQSKRPVTDILKEAFPLTALLAVSAISIAIILGIVAGVFCALYKDTWFDQSTLFVSVLGMSVPSFFAAILFAWLFAYVLGDITNLNMFGSLFEVDDFGNGEHIVWKNLILPAITLGIRPLSVVIELTRSSLLDVLSQDYIRTARAKGLPEKTVIIKHGLRNALNPVVTAISGWFASLMAGAVFIEYIFDWKGIGMVIVHALETYDFPVLMGSVLFISVILVFINIFVDVIYGWLDPRIRLT